MKDYSLAEVFEMEKDTIVELYPYFEDSKQIKLIEMYDGHKYLYYIDDKGNMKDGVIVNNWLMYEARFIKVKPSVSLAEVINQNKRCKIEHYMINQLIENEEDGQSFLWLSEYQYLKDIMCAIAEEFNKTGFNEILREAKWYLEESEDE